MGISSQRIEQVFGYGGYEYKKKFKIENYIREGQRTWELQRALLGDPPLSI